MHWGVACAYCRSDFENGDCITQDHVKSLHAGGVDHTENIVPCCFGCNVKKGRSEVSAWMAKAGLDHAAFTECHEDYNGEGRLAALRLIHDQLATFRAEREKIQPYNGKS